MLCDTCQRQSNCLTHQLAHQDQKLHRMLEQLQGCQQRQPQASQTRSYRQRLVQFRESISRGMAQDFRK